MLIANGDLNQELAEMAKQTRSTAVASTTRAEPREGAATARVQPEVNETHANDEPNPEDFNVESEDEPQVEEQREQYKCSQGKCSGQCTTHICTVPRAGEPCHGRLSIE